MQATKITYELPKILPQGWKTAVAGILGIHRNTLTKAIKRGGEDPMYVKIMNVARQKYGKPIKTEEIC
jgi:hypothetical protein